MHAPASPPASPPKVAKTQAFSHANVLTSVQKKQYRELLLKQGIRLLPYPFASAVAIVSDVDNSTRGQYARYMGTLVDDLGLDFGDSTWLQWRYYYRQTEKYGMEFGFFSRYFSIGRDEAPEIYKHTRTFVENLAEFHSGNLDHFHAFLPYGPRVVLADRLHVRDGRLEAAMDAFQTQGRWRCRGLFLFGVCVVAAPGCSVAVRGVSVHERGGEVTDAFRPTDFAAPPNGREHRLLTLASGAEDEARAPQLDHVEKVVIAFDDPDDAANVERVLLLSVHGAIILDRLALLRERYNVETSLVTDHAAYHFRNVPAAEIKDRLQRAHVDAYRGPTEALHGSLQDADGTLVFSTDADDPHSLCRVLPELSEAMELRFVVPAGNTASKASGWDPLDLVTPALTRSGSGIYVARRMLPNIAAVIPGKAFDGTLTRQETFAARLARVLDATRAQAGLMFPIYTHLGGFEDDFFRDLLISGFDEKRLPSPYFEPGPLNGLQDRAFNMTGDVRPEERLWFTRASLLYDYALMLRGIAEHVERPDDDTVRIASWFDPILGKTLPRSPAQLYGLTFDVDDAAKAAVWLDGEPIDMLARNPADATGRASVTVLASEIKTIVFDALDPTANLPDEVARRGGDWRWSPAGANEPSFGRLAVGGGMPNGEAQTGKPAGVATLKLPLHGLTPTGAQHFACAVRRDPGAAFGTLLETAAGGLFYFGDKSVVRHLDREPSARYLFEPRHRAGAWRVLAAPFHDLSWAAGSRAGGPMPNHALASLTILCAGPPGAGVDLAKAIFFRPRGTTVPCGEDPRFCLGGRVPDFAPGQTVFAVPAGSDRAAPESVAVDQRGYFCFAGMARGIYEVWSTAGQDEWHDRRGRLVEVGGNVMNLVLNRRCALASAA